MKTQIDFNGTKSSADTGAVKVVILYENFAFATGVRGKNFARRLADSLGCSCDLSDATWRSDLFEREDVADAATLAAVDADYVIVSLLGEHVLPVAARNWIEAWLDDAGRRGAGLIVLADPNHSGCRVVEATRHYLHCACTAKGVAFFSDVETPDESCVAADCSAGDEAFEFELSKRW